MPAFEPLRQSRSCLTKSSKRSASCPTERVPGAPPPTTPPPSPVSGAFPSMLFAHKGPLVAGHHHPPNIRRHLYKLPSPYWYSLDYDRNGELIDPSMDPEVWSISSTTVQTACPPGDCSPPTKESIARCVMCFTGVYLFLALIICTPLSFFYRWCWTICSGAPTSEFYQEYALRHSYPTVETGPGLYWSIVAVIYSCVGPVLNHFAFGALRNWTADYINDAAEGSISSRTHSSSSIRRYREGRRTCKAIEWRTVRRALQRLYQLQGAILYILAVVALLIAGVVALVTLVGCPAELV